jgi:hypothetical protein
LNITVVVGLRPYTAKANIRPEQSGPPAYERLGFHLCGLDTSLYDATASQGEVALFLSRSPIVE